MHSDAGEPRAFYQLFADLASGTLEHVTDPVKCAEYVASQVRELLGVKAVAVVASQGHGSPHRLLAVSKRVSSSGQAEKLAGMTGRVAVK